MMNLVQNLVTKRKVILNLVRVIKIIKITMYFRERKMKQETMQIRMFLTLENLKWRIKS